MELFLEPGTWIALLTLTFLEIVLGVDNIIFISIVSNKLPEAQRTKARNIGLSLALLMRIGMLFGITWIITFTEPLFTFPYFDQDMSGRDLILMAGGLFLIAKSTTEIHHKMEGEAEHVGGSEVATLRNVILQIVMLDVIFSFDSILTAIGMTEHLILMIIAVVISMIIMMTFAGKISSFIKKHPSLEVLALSFLILIGFMLLLESMGMHVEKGFIYFAVFFALMVEVVNMRVRKKRKPVVLNKRMDENDVSDQEAQLVE